MTPEAAVPSTAPRRVAPPQAVVIGASAGAIEALSAILPRFPANTPACVIVVVHLPPDQNSMLPELFQRRCRLEVIEAEDQEPLRAGTIYFAPPDYHLLVESTTQLALSSDEPVLFSRPSIDVLFESAADVFRSRLIGVVLTGGNADGAAGLRRIVAANGSAIVQDPASAYMPAMPEAALAACPQAARMTLDRIGDYLAEVSATP